MFEERGFRRWFMGKWDYWQCPVEPRQGGLAGIPDLLVMMPESHPWSRGRQELTAVELKVGVVDDYLNILFELRPVQRQWLAAFHEAGGHSVIAVGLKSAGHWKAYGLLDPTPSQLIHNKRWPLDMFTTLY